MRMYTFAKRNAKEILRDPINLCFGLGFPLVLLLLLCAIQANVPVALFEIRQLAPGIAVFGLSFLTLFCATLIAKDRTGALLQRLYTTPLQASDFILGYGLPILPIAVVQSVVCYGVAICLGLEITGNILLAVAMIVPVSILYIALGLLCGSVFTDKQVGGICGALLTNLSAWLSGVWFDLELMGEGFQKAANLLPFVHAVALERAALSGNTEAMLPHLWWVLGYGLGLAVLAVAVFLHRMRTQ